MTRLRKAMACALLCTLPACAERNAGVVELAWVFVDRDGQPIYPGGVFSVDAQRDSCDLRATIDDGNTEIFYDLQVQLEICDPSCPEGCDDPACLVMDPLQFPCNTSRGSEREVPASPDPYRFTLRTSVRSNVNQCNDPEPTCIAVPGPRDRTVTAGLVTDLQVYQISVDVSDQSAKLDLEGCGCA